jgi:hypothetical protein
MDIERRTKQLGELESSLFDCAYKISKKIYGKSDHKKDIRYTTYNTLSSIIRSTRLLLILKYQYLDDDAWWIGNYKQHFQYLDKYFGISENGRETFRKNSYKIIPDDLIHFINVSLYSSLFSIMESRFRLFYNYLVTSDKAGKKGEIMDRPGMSIIKISEDLLNKIGFCQKLECIKLFANIRNTIHNNGVYTHDDCTISYNDGEYKFEKGKPPDYKDSWDLLILDILPDVIKVLDKMISLLLDEVIIEDPFTKSNTIIEY